MGTKSFVLLFAAACIAAVAVFFLRSDSDRVDASIERTPTIEREAAAPSDDLALAPTASATTRAVSTVTRPAASSASPAGTVAHPWDEMLAGLSGRVLEEDGTPVEGMRVELLEGDASLLLEANFTALGRVDIGVDEARTDAEGRFLLEGAIATAFHALSLDGGGPRSAIRIVEHGLAFGEVTDVGDLVLPAYGTVIGTVFDDDGEPVAGARVRLAPVPEPVLQSGILDLRDDCIIAFGQPGNDLELIDLPPWILDNMERLPVPTTYTTEDGSFRLEGVPLAVVAGGVDLEGHVATVIPPFEMNVEEYDVGELDLVEGRIVVGRVVDTLGEPVPGAVVRTGALHPMFNVGVLQPAIEADEDGRFTVPGIGEIGPVVAAARRDEREEWVVANASAGSSSVSITLPAAAPLTVRAQDEVGEPVEGATVSMRPKAAGQGFFSMGFAAMLGTRRAPDTYRVSEAEPGVYVVDALALGEWVVRVEGAGHATVEKTVQHTSERTVCDVTCLAGRTIVVTALDSVSGEPVPNAFARVLGPSEPLFGGLASSFTDDAGKAQLGPLPPPGEEPESPWMWGSGIGLQLTVEHPTFGLAARTIPDDSNEIVVQLEPTGSVVGRVRWGEVAPQTIYMLALTSRGRDGAQIADALITPRTTLSDLEGAFRFDGLSSGSYTLSVFERFLNADPMTFIVEQKDPELISRTDVEVQSGESTDVDVQLGVTGEGAKTTFVGQVVINGVPSAGARVEIGGKQDQSLATDGVGRFESEPVSTLGAYRIRIHAEIELLDGSIEEREIYSDRVRPQSGEHSIDVDIAYEPFVIEVLDIATGEPLEGANVDVGEAPSVMTGADGRAEAMLMEKRVVTNGSAKVDEAVATAEAGSVPSGVSRSIRVKAETYANYSERHECDPAGLAPHLSISMRKPAPCAGRVVLPADAGEPDWIYLTIDRNDGGQEWVMLDNEDLAFRIEGLSPGEYTISLIMNGLDSDSKATISLDERGDENLVLRFD